MQKRSANEFPLHVGNLSRPGDRDKTTRCAALRALGPGVYAIRTRHGHIKIGYSIDLGRRVGQLAAQDVLGFVIGGTYDDEQAIHRHLQGHAVRGREYYPETTEVLEVVNLMRQRIGLSDLKV
jgi:hypothetical protein